MGSRYSKLGHVSTLASEAAEQEEGAERTASTGILTMSSDRSRRREQTTSLLLSIALRGCAGNDNASIGAKRMETSRQKRRSLLVK
jgi:hypothetical protein